MSSVDIDVSFASVAVSVVCFSNEPEKGPLTFECCSMNPSIDKKIGVVSEASAADIDM